MAHIIKGNTDEEWNASCEALTGYMVRMNKTGRKWFATVRNAGWRKLSGEWRAPRHCADGRSLLLGILPHTDCHFEATVDLVRKVITVIVWHHDNGDGDETYTVKLAARGA